MAWTENALKTMDCFIAAYRNVNVSHLFEHIPFDHFHGGTFVPLPSGVLEVVEILGLYFLLFLAGATRCGEWPAGQF